MKSFFAEIFDWVEVWALLIPLAVFFWKRPHSPWIKPIKYYLIIAFVVNLLSILIWKQIRYGYYDWVHQAFPSLHNADGTYSNTLLYNINSIIRLISFTWFFSLISPVYRKLNVFFIPAFTIFFSVYFLFKADIRDFNSLLLTTEAAILLLYCVVYFIYLVLQDKVSPKSHGFWIVAGLSLYVAISFFIFLFFNYLMRNYTDFAVSIWDVHNSAFLIFCVLIAVELYRTNKLSDQLIRTANPGKTL